MSRTGRRIPWKSLLIAGVLAATALNVALFVARRSAPPAGGVPTARPGGDDGVPTLGPVADFALLDQYGRFHQLSRHAGQRALVLFTHGVGCNIVAKSVPELRRLAERFQRDDVGFLMINSNPQDSRESIRQDMEKLGLDVPVLVDESQLVGEMLELRRTAEALLIDTHTWKIVYRGPVDDRLDYEVERPVRHHWLSDAVDAFLAGREVAQAWRPAVGCLINLHELARNEKVSYTHDVAPILERRCRLCHLQGGVAPWSMDSYEIVHGWAPMMQQVLLTRRMPPWHADPAIGQFRNDRSLPVDERRTLVHWIEAGAPRGDGDDPLLEKPAHARAWPLGRPDVVVRLRPQKVPAEGALDYRYVIVPVPEDHDVWVRAAQIRPSNAAVMHHSFAFVQPPGDTGEAPAWANSIDEFLAVYVPGYVVAPFPEGTGKRIPAHSNLVIQLHYNAVGYETEDRPVLGLYLDREPPGRELHTRGAFNQEFEIPPNDPDVPVFADFTFERDATLYGLMPHMHFRGKRMRYVATYPDGSQETLLSVPHYNFNWQRLYEFQEPKRMPAGTRVHVEGAFDNSALNPFNPDPSKLVRWGFQSWDEMFIGYLVYAYDEPADGPMAWRGP
jgi:peroxiredoxin